MSERQPARRDRTPPSRHRIATKPDEPAAAVTQTSTSTATVSQTTTKGIDPCSFLGSEIDGFPLRVGVVDNSLYGAVGARACDYLRADTHGDVVSVGLWDGKGINELNFRGDIVTPIIIGGRQGKEDHNIGGPGSCAVSLPVGPHSTAETYYNGRDTDPCCEIAEAAARVMVQKLPPLEK